MWRQRWQRLTSRCQSWEIRAAAQFGWPSTPVNLQQAAGREDDATRRRHSQILPVWLTFRVADPVCRHENKTNLAAQASGLLSGSNTPPAVYGYLAHRKSSDGSRNARLKHSELFARRPNISGDASFSVMNSGPRLDLVRPLADLHLVALQQSSSQAPLALDPAFPSPLTGAREKTHETHAVQRNAPGRTARCHC